MFRYVREGGWLFGLVYLVWRASRRVSAWFATQFYRRVLKSVDTSTRFGSGVYVTHPRCIVIGKGCQIADHTHLTSEASSGWLTLADDVQLSTGVKVDYTGGLQIGRKTLVSAGAVIYTHDHGYEPRSAPVACSLTIGDNVWVGLNAIIMPNVRSIGEGAIVGAGAVVTRAVPPFAIVAGNPARLVGAREGARVDAGGNLAT